MTHSLAGGAVILAAGESTRFGSDKRNFRLAGGRTMLEVTLGVYQCVFDEIVIVLKPADESWAGQLCGVRLVYAPESALGMGHSLAAGVGAVRHLDYLFIALADMPYVQAQTLIRLNRSIAGPESIILPVYRGASGHPVGFGSNYYDELVQLTGDVGAKRIVNAHPASTARIVVEDSGTVRDIDTPP